MTSICKARASYVIKAARMPAPAPRTYRSLAI